METKTEHIRTVFVLAGIMLLLAFNLLPGATFIVINNLDAGPGSLRDAINLANGNGIADTITFNIPGTGVVTIYPLSQLPQLTDPGGVLIDGLTQAGASAGANPPATATLMVEINGAQAGNSHGLWIVAPNNTIQGLVVDSFAQDGIRIEGMPAPVSNNLVYCNFVGTDPSGNTAQGNGTNMVMYWAGVNIIVTPANPGFAHNNTIRGNLISDNYAEGVGISNCPPGDVYQNTVVSNYIGTDITGMIDLGNVHDGVYIGEGAHDNIVDSNLISGNDFEGVCIVGYDELQIYTNSNIVRNNIIGLTITLTSLPNTIHGVSIGVYGTVYQGGFSCKNTIGPNNTIADNGRSGVMVWEHPRNNVNADNNRITRNTIYGNALLGIDLQDDTVTLNDPGDPDARANEEVNFPVITSASFANGQTTISGTININTLRNQAVVEVFAATVNPAYGYGQGAYYLGSATPNAAGNWSLTVTDTMANAGKVVTATVTDMNNNTSEFCNNVTVTGSTKAVKNLQGMDNGFSMNVISPFSSSTSFSFYLAEKKSVSLRIFDVSGKHVRTLAQGIFPASYHTVRWNGMDMNGKNLTPGLYICRFRTAQTSVSAKIFKTN